MRNSNTQSVSSNLGIGGEKYPYTHQLLQLDQCRRQGQVPDELKSVESPLVVSQWSSLLKDHPDKQFAQYVLTGIAEGFRIGFDYVWAECRSAQSNLRSAESNPDVVETYLQEEVALDRVVGPWPPGKFPSIQISPFGVIPKGHSPRKW